MKFLILAFSLFSSPVFALTKAEALQVSKNRIETLSESFAILSYSCFVYEEDCLLENDLQGSTLKLISDEQHENPPVIQYARGPDQFMIDGAIRIAKTGRSWGVPVIFNEDLLTRETSPGNFEALDLFEVIGVLVHEFGHHQEEFYTGTTGKPFLEHQELDVLAMKVVTYLKDRTRQIRITQDEIAALPEGHEISIYQMDIEQNIGVRLMWSNIFIDSRFETLEVSKELVKGVLCPKIYTRGHLTFLGVPYYAAFKKVQAPHFETRGQSLIITQDIGDASVLCIDGKMGVFNVFDGYTQGKVAYEFSLKDGRYLYSPASRFSATAPPDKEYR